MSAPAGPGGPPFADADEYARRRAEAARRVGDGALVVAAGRPTIYARDVENRFRPRADFLYLTGLVEPDAVLVLRPSAPAPLTLFVRPRDPEREAWMGARPGPEGVLAAGLADAAFALADLPARLPDLLDGAEPLYFAPWEDDAADAAVRAALGALASREALGRRAPQALVHPGAVLHEMRLVKSDAELRALERAAAITVAGFRAGLAAVRPGAAEYEVQAALERAFRAAGAAGPGFGTIVGAGANGVVLHYTANRGTIAAGDLVLVDAGAEADFYNGDVTRTVPATGAWRPAQRALYEAVLGVEEALIAAARPGASLGDLRALGALRLAAALVDLGVLRGDAEAIVAEGRHKKYTIHGPGHWLGLDVHDVGSAFRGGAPRPFEPGHVLTIEPGLYFPPDDEAVPAELRGQAVRIEDDVVITRDGARTLTRGLPVDPDDVARLVGAAGETT